MFRIGKKFSKPMMSRVVNGDIEIKVKEREDERIRLDQLLVKKYPEYKRATLQKFIKAGYVGMGGIVLAKANMLVEPEAQIELRVPEFKSASERPPVIYEDEHVLVLNKPAGLLSMKKGEIADEPTLEDFGFLVHRLDRETSGVVVLAKDIETRGMLQKQFQERKVKKSYLAITDVRLKLPTAKIDLPIARNLKRPTTFEVNPNGREAITEYQVLHETAHANLVLLKPTTGRTHQLRVHLKYLNAPILGDMVYGNKKAKRLFLHAYKLELSIPGKNGMERKIFYAEVPEEFQEKIGEFEWAKIKEVA